MSSEVSSVNWFLERKAEGKKFVLSIDGGGTMGLLPLHCLKKLEDLAGQPCYELFDFYAGTSTGAIIAGALACRMTAEKIIELYKGFIDYVFPPKPRNTFLGWLVQTFINVAPKHVRQVIDPQLEKSIQFLSANDLKYMYDHDKLWELIKQYLRMPGNEDNLLTFRDVYEMSTRDFGTPKRLMITFKDVERSETLFAVNAGPGAPAFADMPVAYAVLASAVAPIYLEPFTVWVDGGVGSFSNPCYRAVVEAKDYFTGAKGRDYETIPDDAKFESDNLIVFSFGTGHIPNYRTNAPKGEQNQAGGNVSEMIFFDWMRYIILEQLDEANDEQVRLTQQHFGEVDFRRYQLVLDPSLLKAPVNEGGIGLDLPAEDQERLARLDMASSADEDVKLMDRLGQAWAQAIDGNFAKPHYPFEKKSPYWPAGAVPLSFPSDLETPMPPALIAYRNATLPPLADYMEKKVSELAKDPRYQSGASPT